MDQISKTNFDVPLRITDLLTSCCDFEEKLEFVTARTGKDVGNGKPLSVIPTS